MRTQMALLTALVAVSLAGCGGDETDAPATDASAPVVGAQSPPTFPTGHPAPSQWKPSDDPKLAKFMGLVAPKPATWIEHPPSGMGRVANYTVPGLDGSKAADVVVHYFGRGQGGPIQDNIERWQNQFRSGPDGAPPDPIVESFEADGMPVTLVELAGEWTQVNQGSYTEDQLFMAVIVQTPEGNVFIRIAGRTATVEANRQAFRQMVEGLRRGDAPM